MTERGVVLRGTGGVWTVLTESGIERDVSMRGRLKQADTPKLAVGDAVMVEPDARGTTAAIAEILPRRSTLARRAPGGAHGERIIVANVDQVVVVFAAAKPDPHPRMLDRFLVIAEGNSLAARIVVNKIDLTGEGAARERFGHYERIGYPVHFTSVALKIGLEPLRAALDGRVSVLTGPSGVGKSSLLNTVYPGFNLRVGAISESVNKGRHTTVGASLHALPGGGFVADTPGLREIGLWGFPAGSVAECFPEFRERLGNCRFADCTHDVEPGCAVRDALARGDVDAERYESYRKLREELKESEQRW